MNESLKNLQRVLGFSGDLEHTEFVIPDADSFNAALRQWMLLMNAGFTEEESAQLETTIHILDTLQSKYLKRIYTIRQDQAQRVAGLLLTYRRAMQAIAAGLLGEIFFQFEYRPIVFRVLFGDRLGYELYLFAEHEAHRMARIEELRTMEKAAPGQYLAQIEDEINEMTREERQLAMSLGMTQDTADRIGRDLYVSRVNGTRVRLSKIAQEVQVHGGETITWRVKRGRAALESGLYPSPKQVLQLSTVDDQELMHQAVQTAKDLDRARVGRQIYEASEYNLTKHGRYSTNYIGRDAQ